LLCFQSWESLQKLSASPVHFGKLDLSIQIDNFTRCLPSAEPLKPQLVPFVGINDTICLQWKHFEIMDTLFSACTCSLTAAACLLWLYSRVSSPWVRISFFHSSKAIQRKPLTRPILDLYKREEPQRCSSSKWKSFKLREKGLKLITSWGPFRWIHTCSNIQDMQSVPQFSKK